MKNFKQFLLAFIAVFAAIFLVACGAKSDNGTYVFEPTKDEIKEIMPSEFKSRPDCLFNFFELSNFHVVIKHVCVTHQRILHILNR